MRRTLIKILLTIITLQAFVVSARAYSIKLEIRNLPDQYVYLAQYHGFSSQTLDSVKSKNGIAEFKGKNALPQGIYYIFTKEKKLFDFHFANNKKTLTLSTDIEDPAYHLTVSGDETSKSFNEAHKTILGYRKQLDDKMVILAGNKHWGGDTVEIKKEIDSINNQYIDFLHSEMKKQKKGDFLYNLYKMAFGAQWPGYNPITDLDFSNPDLLNTPEYSFRSFIEKYCEKNIDAYADNIMVAIANAEHIIHKTDPQSDYRAHILDYIVITYLSTLHTYPRDLRLEAVSCKLWEEYYSEKPWWMSDYDYSFIKWRYDITKSNVIGMKGKNITLPDAQGNNHSLYELKSKYKILVFWDSECEVCIEKVSHIQADYNELKAMGAEVFAVYTEAEYEQWKEYIAENELNWINVSDPEGVGTYDYDYGTYKTPRLYLLDENNIIIAKDFDSAKIIETISKQAKGN
ncbi:MAG: AhpC/TSA family protein [Bacteroidales bacterium]|nr:AhpC/TSA family protein [Bacteroidales bacterium]